MSRGVMARWWGPVFDAERTTRARRWQGYALRSLFVLGLLGGLTLAWSDQSSATGPVTVESVARLGASAYSVLTCIELVAVMIIAPAATAGAICLDKTRGSLAHVFVTDLSNREIILGKLAARLLPVWGLLACTLPVSAMMTLMGGVDPVALTGLFVLIVGLAVLGCSFALMLSVWASKPHEVISVVFGVWALWIFAWPLWMILDGIATGTMTVSSGWLAWTNPFFWAFSPYLDLGQVSIVGPILFCLGCLVLGAGFTAVAIGKVRVVGCRSPRPGAGRVGIVGRVFAWVRQQVRWGQGPRLDANPVLWREWHRNRPSRWSQVVWMSFGVINALVGLGLIVAKLMGEDYLLDSAEVPALAIGSLACLGLLLVSASTASVLADERAQGSLDVLMSTPISTRTIVGAKWRGAFRRVPWLACWPTVVGVVHAVSGRPDFAQLGIIYLVPVLIVAQGAALVSLGLALATWIKRTGQATAWTVAALVVSAVGWLVVGDFMALDEWFDFESSDSVGALVLEGFLFMGSPLANIIEPLAIAASDGPNYREHQEILILVAAWALIYSLAAWGLFEATVRTFDRCFGRSPEHAIKPRIEPTLDRQRRRLGSVRGWGSRIPGGGGRPGGHAGSFAPPPR